MKEEMLAVRGVLINDGKLLCIKNKIERENYYDLPGGQIEEGETKEEACIREFKEETGVNIYEPMYKGTVIIENSNHIYNLKIFVINKFDGTPCDFHENFSMWMDVDEYLSKELLYANAIVLDKFFYKVLNGEKEFEIKMCVDEFDNIFSLNFKYV